MRNRSKLVMGTLLLVGMSLLIVLGLVLVLLAELYCSLLSRRRRIPATNSSAAAENDQKPTEEESKINTILQESKSGSPLYPSTSAYSQGVLCPPPRALLFGTRKGAATEAQQHQAPHEPIGTAFQQVGLISASSQASSPPSVIPPISRKKLSSSPYSTRVEIAFEDEPAGIVRNSSGGSASQQFLCISNPIYDEEACIGSTPFQTPYTSPSRFEEEECSETEDATEAPSPPAACVLTPPLSPMKKLPPNAASVTLTDGRFLIPSTTDSNASSSTSASPCTSPSW